MLTTTEIIDLAKDARLRHEERVFESERQYKVNIHNIQGQCPHEFSDIKHIVDHNDVYIHVRYCTACWKELE